jgi:hypothetical protein
MERYKEVQLLEGIGVLEVGGARTSVILLAEWRCVQ